MDSSEALPKEHEMTMIGGIPCQIQEENVRFCSNTSEGSRTMLIVVVKAIKTGPPPRIQITWWLYKYMDNESRPTFHCLSGTHDWR